MTTIVVIAEADQRTGAPQATLPVRHMDAPTRQRLLDMMPASDIMQARLASYHEDENGQPTFPPERGMLTLSAGADLSQTGLSAICALSPEGNLLLWECDTMSELLNAPL